MNRANFIINLYMVAYDMYKLLEDYHVGGGGVPGSWAYQECIRMGG